MMRLRFPLSALLDSASSHLEAHLLQKKESAPTKVAGSSPYTGIIFSGNPHEAVPRRLLLDDRLTPLERNTWQVFRLLINGDGVTAFPTYDQLRPYLGMQPGKPASRETISKSLVTLRLTRWLSLGRRVRSDLSGQVQGNVYLLHDEPVSPAEAIELDKDYLQLLSQSMSHQNKAIRDVAKIAWNEFAADPDVGARLPTRMDVIEERLNTQCSQPREHDSLERPISEFGIRTESARPEFGLHSESELSPDSANERDAAPSSDSQLSLNPGSLPSVRNPNSYSTYTNTYKDVCKSSVHVPREPEELGPKFLEAVHSLPVEQKQVALDALAKVPSSQKAALLKQWVHRLGSGSLRNPVGYLLTLVSSAVRGEFNSAWIPDQPVPPAGAPTTDTDRASESPADVNPRIIQTMETPTEPMSRSPETIATAQREISAMISQLRFRRPNAS